MIDTHCHLTFPQLHDHLPDVLARARTAGVDTMITVATTLDDARHSAQLASEHQPVFATVGVHPHYSPSCNDRLQLAATMQELAATPKVVALGEMGLDRHYDDPPIDAQKKIFSWQLEIAAGLDLPIIIHNRQATDETLAMIRDSGIPGARFVFHCFTGSAAELDAILAINAMVSFTGIVTFKNSADLALAAASVPLDRLMVETDAPYLTPEPHRKTRPNEPCYVPHVARFLARQRRLPEPDFTATLDANARRFFRLPLP